MMNFKNSFRMLSIFFLLLTSVFASEIPDDPRSVVEHVIAHKDYLEIAPWRLLFFTDRPSENEFKKRFRKIITMIYPTRISPELKISQEKINEASFLVAQSKRRFDSIKSGQSYTEFNSRPPQGFSNFIVREEDGKFIIHAETEFGVHTVIFKGKRTEVKFTPTKLRKVPFEGSHTQAWLKGLLEIGKSLEEVITVMAGIHGEKLSEEQKAQISAQITDKQQARIDMMKGHEIYDVMAPGFRFESLRVYELLEYARANLYKEPAESGPRPQINALEAMEMVKNGREDELFEKLGARQLINSTGKDMKQIEADQREVKKLYPDCDGFERK